MLRLSDDKRELFSSQIITLTLCIQRGKRHMIKNKPNYSEFLPIFGNCMDAEGRAMPEQLQR
jgi:hypothetical protein